MHTIWQLVKPPAVAISFFVYQVFNEPSADSHAKRCHLYASCPMMHISQHNKKMPAMYLVQTFLTTNIRNTKHSLAMST